MCVHKNDECCDSLNPELFSLIVCAISKSVVCCKIDKFVMCSLLKYHDIKCVQLTSE